MQGGSLTKSWCYVKVIGLRLPDWEMQQKGKFIMKEGLKVVFLYLMRIGFCVEQRS